MQNIFETFEFRKIQESLAKYSKTDLGHSYIASLSFLSVEELKLAKQKLEEMVSLLMRFGPLPINVSKKAIDIIETAKKSGILTCKDFYDISVDIETTFALAKYFKKVDNTYPLMNALHERICDLSNLYEQIKKIVSNALTVKDDASPELYSIRAKIKAKEKKLQELSIRLSDSYKDYLNDERATIRDGHIVLPVKVGMKNKISGIIYDISDSGGTVFIEPMEIVELNNEITALKISENEEVRKILLELTNLVIIQEKEIVNNNKIIGELDFISAKAHYHREIDGTIALFSHTRTIELLEARHPLIDPQKVVANSYRLDEEKRILIISGPNAGGKTVSLKTVGLLVLMNQCGLSVPAQKAKLSYFSHIYVDIGDNQSLTDNLSTFSAHISQIGNILTHVKGNDLVLIDELGTGTDPIEGQAIALSVVQFLEKRGCFALISSHFNALKEYAFLSKWIENSSMMFDEQKLLPTYLFKEGVPGKSYAFEVAYRYGLPKEIIERAQQFLDSGEHKDEDNILQILQEKLVATVRLEKELQIKDEQLQKKDAELTKLAQSLNEKKQHLLEEVEEEKEKLLEQAKDKIDEIIKSVQNQPDIKTHQFIDAKGQLDNLKKDIELEEFNEQIAVGDYVYLPSMHIYGVVKRIQGKKAYLDSDAGLSVEALTSRLKKLDRPIEKAKPVIQKKIVVEDSLPLQLNLIGYHVDEALEALDKYIDQAKVRHMHQVRIIHGFGSGALRNAAHEYLKKQKGLTFRLGNEYEGGGGATVVTFDE